MSGRQFYHAGKLQQQQQCNQPRHQRNANGAAIALPGQDIAQKVVRFLRFWCNADVTEAILSQAVLYQAREHPDGSHPETEVPVDFFRQQRHDDLSEEGTEIDTHVKDGKSGIASCAALGVKIADNGADIGLEQPRAHRYKSQTDEKNDRAARNGQNEVSDHNENTSVPNGFALSENIIRQPATGQGEQIDGCGVKPINRAGSGRVQPQPFLRCFCCHKQDKNSAHAVVAEALPHFGEKQCGKPTRMTKKALLIRHCCVIKAVT